MAEHLIQPRYRCPVCGRHDDLRVEVNVICRVLQDLDEDNVETEPDRHAEWVFDDTSMMLCNACEHTASVATFATDTSESHVNGKELGATP